MSLVVAKALKLVDAVARGQETLSELVGSSGLSRSTTHRLLSSLVAQGYLDYSARRYGLGYRLLELGEAKRRSLRFLDPLQPVLRRYADLTFDTIHVALLDGTDIVLVECVAGQRELQIRSYVGQRAAAFSTAVGKALIGQRPTAEWPDFIRNLPNGYPKSRAVILADFETARRRRVGVDRDEVSIGTCGIASTFMVGEGLRAAVSINGATVYFDEDRLARLNETVLELAGECEKLAAKIKGR